MLVATLIAILISLTIFGGVLFRITRREDRFAVMVSLLSTLPMCWIMLHLIRMPIDSWLQNAINNTELHSWVRSFYAPLTEEPAKLWILLLSWIRHRISKTNVVSFAIALGLGFALGEMVTVAGLVVIKDPQVAAMPWYMLGGFITERFMTCAIHSGMTGVALVVWRCGHRFPASLLLAMMAHYLVNIPIFLAQKEWFGSNATVVQTLLFLWVLFCFYSSAAFLAWLYCGKINLGKFLLGRAVCPACKTEYDRKMWASINIGMDHSFEKCPSCKKWSWVKRLKENGP